MIKALYDFLVYHHPTKFAGRIHCGGVNITVLVCQVISEDHMMKGSCDFISKDPSRSVKFGGHRYSDSGDIMIFVCHVLCKTTSSKCFMTLWLGASQGKLPPSQIW